MLSAPLAICLAAASSAASTDPLQDIPPVSIPRPPARAASAVGFAPPGWRLERTLSGDLNRDGEPDLVVVLKGDDPACLTRDEPGAEALDTNPRLLVVAFRRGRDYTLHLANAAVIPRLDDPFMDDPLEIGDLAIQGGTLRLTLGHWRSAGGWGTYSNSFAFRWDGAAFRLIGFDRDHLQRNSGETSELSVNFLTRRAKVTKGSMEDGVDDKVTWKRAPPQPAVTLETFGNGLEYDVNL